MSASQTQDVVRYIRNQKEHHARKSYDDEFVDFLKRYGIAYDPAYAGIVFVSSLRDWVRSCPHTPALEALG